MVNVLGNLSPAFQTGMFSSSSSSEFDISNTLHYTPASPKNFEVTTLIVHKLDTHKHWLCLLTLTPKPPVQAWPPRALAHPQPLSCFLPYSRRLLPLSPSVLSLRSGAALPSLSLTMSLPYQKPGQAPRTPLLFLRWRPFLSTPSTMERLAPSTALLPNAAF